jgi:tetratricopeptide (TPR) repeat protein
MRLRLGSLLLLLRLTGHAQGWGRSEAIRPWLQGHFNEAEQQFVQARSLYAGPDLPVVLWQAEFAIDAGRFKAASALLKEASDYQHLKERREALLSFALGRYIDAFQKSLENHRWDRKDVSKLKVHSPISLTVLGQITFSAGDYTTALALFEKALHEAKRPDGLFALEWIKSENGIALTELQSNSPAEAAKAALSAVEAAQRQWGPSSIPAIDVLDTIGLVRMRESNWTEADLALTKSREWREKVYGTVHPKVAESYLHAAQLHAAQNDFEKAIPDLKRAIQIEKSLFLGPNGRSGVLFSEGAEIFIKAGQGAQGRELYDLAVPLIEREFPSDSPMLVLARKRQAALGSTE